MHFVLSGGVAADRLVVDRLVQRSSPTYEALCQLLLTRYEAIC